MAGCKYCSGANDNDPSESWVDEHGSEKYPIDPGCYGTDVFWVNVGSCGHDEPHGYMEVFINMEWKERVPYKVGNISGECEVNTGIDTVGMCDVSYCPWCGRKL